MLEHLYKSCWILLHKIPISHLLLQVLRTVMAIWTTTKDLEFTVVLCNALSVTLTLNIYRDLTEAFIFF